MTPTSRDLVLYARDRGAICYEKQLANFSHHEPFAEFLDQITSSSLQWYWDSIRRHDAATDAPVHGLPQERMITKLEVDTISTLRDDFKEVNYDGEHRFFDLYGLIPETMIDMRVDADFHRAMEKFSSSGEGPLQVVIVQDGDSDSAMIFVPPVQDARLEALMQTWGISSAAVFRTWDYASLTSQTLESRYLRKNP